jgi:hypothetical protein
LNFIEVEIGDLKKCCEAMKANSGHFVNSDMTQALITEVAMAEGDAGGAGRSQWRAEIPWQEGTQQANSNFNNYNCK